MAAIAERPLLAAKRADASDDDGEGGDAKVESPTNALQIWSFSVAEVS